MKKIFLVIFLSVFFFASLAFLLTEGTLNRSHQPTKNQTARNDLKKDNQNNKKDNQNNKKGNQNDKDNQNNKVENSKETAAEEFKSDEVFGNSHYFEIFTFFLAPVINLIVQIIRFKDKGNDDETKRSFLCSFILFYFIFSFVIAEFIINHLGGSLYRYGKSKKYRFLTIFKNSLKRRLRIITLVFLLVHFVFAFLLFWICCVCFNFG